MIIFEPLGGLGNQLFTYGVGLANSVRLETDLWVDRRNFVDYDWHDYELGSFKNSIAGEVDASKSPSRSGGEILGGLLDRVFPRRHNGLDESVVREETNHFSPRFLKVENETRLRGYFQSWKYLEQVGDLLNTQLWELTNPSGWFIDKRRELEAGSPWIGVHLRLGNYQSLPAMGVAAEVYYERSLRLLADLGYEMPVIVFTDSPEIVTSIGTFVGLDNWQIFDSSGANSSLETLLLMSLASHLVIGNSTFSWWAGWLGRHEIGRRVIYPRPWIDLQSWNDRDLPLPGWIGLSREINTVQERKLG